MHRIVGEVCAICIVVVAGGLASSACFHPVYDDPACGPGATCPSGLVCDGTICRAPSELSPLPDAPDPPVGFDISTCPATYTTMLPGFSTTTSRYRLLKTGADAATQSDLCNADLPGRTHLIVFESLAEADAVAQLVNDTSIMPQISQNAIWIGAVQLRTALTPAEGWIGFDDQPLLEGLWSLSGIPEPDDQGGMENDHREQFAEMERTESGRLADNENANQSGALCECDGKPIGPMAAAAVESNRH